MEKIKYTQRQLDILRILREQTFCESNLAEIYQGALITMDNTLNPERLPQAAHSLRELNNIMMRHIKAVTQERKKNSQREKMKKFLKEFDELGGIEKDTIIKQWHELHDYFVKIAHHGIDNINREDFEQKLDFLENIIFAILGPVYDSIQEIDILIDIENPSKADIEKAFSFIKNLSQYEYFFKNLKNPNWLELLDEFGIFDNTPKLDERSIEPLFLLKVAKIKPEKVLEIIKRHKETDHPGAKINYIRCLIDMPIEYSIQMIKRIKKWINSVKEYTPSLYFTLIDFIQKLIEDDKEKELFDLISSVFAIKEEIFDHDEKVKKVLNEKWKKVDIDHIDPREIYDEQVDLKFQEENQSYLYESLIKKILSNLMEKYPIKTLNLFLVKLRIVINFYLKNQDSIIIEDHSLIWFNDLNKKPIGKNFRIVLVSTVKDILLDISKNHQNKLPEAIIELRKSNYLIFKRLEFYIYNNFPELSVNYLKEIEFVKDLFKDIDENPELYKLVEQFFSKLPKKTQEEYLNYIMEGAKEQENYWKENHPEIPLEKVKEFVKNWQKRKAKPIRNYLEQDDLKKLGIEFQDLEIIELFEDRGVIFGDNSPISANEIKNMSVDDLSSFLINYDDKGGIGFSKIGLGRTLRDYIKERPQGMIELFQKSLEHPKMHKYISFIIDGFSLSLKEGKKVDIMIFPSHFEKILKNEIQINKEPIFWKEDTLRDTKKSIADFVYDNLNPDSIPIELYKRIWELISLLLKEEDLTKEIEISNIERNWMPRDMCLNSVRGVATELVFIYLSWIKNINPEQFNSEDIDVSKLITDTFLTLESLLEDSLYTTRYIFGMNLNFLSSIDINWVKTNILKIFPTNRDNLDYFEASWAGFLDFNNVSLMVFKILRPLYEYAINIMNDERVLIPFSQQGLTNHLVTLYIYGIESLEEENSLIIQFFNKSNTNARRSAIGSIGVHLQQYVNEEDFEKIIGRLIKLMEYRIEKAKAGNLEDYKEELFSFIFWFRNSIFDNEWMINQFLEVLRLLDGSIDVFYDVIDILGDYVTNFPIQVLECLNLIIKSEAKSSYLIYEEKYKNLLKKLLENENAEIKQETVNLVNYLIKLNFHNFKDLLRNEKI